jgi:hypothetical protein
MLVHVVHKSSPRLTPVIAAMITDQAEAVRAMGRAPRDWINQLRVVAEEAGELAAANPDLGLGARQGPQAD